MLKSEQERKEINDYFKILEQVSKTSQESDGKREEFISLQEERIKRADPSEMENEIKKLEEAKKQLEFLKDMDKKR